MVRTLFEKISNRIAHKLALWVIIFSIGATLLASGIQLYLTYKQDLNTIKDYFDSITVMQLNSLSQAVWIMDDRQIQAHLDGIIKGRDIIYSSVLINGQARWFSGIIATDDILSTKRTLTYIQRGAVYKLGVLEIVAGLDELYDRLSKTALIILMTNGLKTFLFAGCILLYFRFAVTRHLEKLASHVINIDFRRKIKPLDLNRNLAKEGDEFTKVVNRLNILQQRGYHAFNALEESEQRLRLFFDATEEGIFGINSDGLVTFANSSCLNMLGFRKTQGVIGQEVKSLLHYESQTPGDIGDRAEIFVKPLQTGRSLISDDGYLQVHGGPAFFASVRVYPVVSNDENTGAVIFFNDISEQREMIREKSLLRQAVRQSPLLIVITDAHGNIEYVNPGFEKFTGYLLKEVSGRKPFFLGRIGKNKDVFREIRNTIDAGEKWHGMYHFRTKDGRAHSFDSLISPVFNERGKIVNLIALCLDITQKITLQKQLHHAHKMEAVGRLSASFAHEFGNPLFGVRSVIKDISERIPMGDGDRQLLRLAYSECERMKSLINDFQRFQSKRSDIKEYHNIHGILDNVLFFYKKHLENNNIVLRKNYQSDMPDLYISKNQIAQVFLNLFINALDAMGKSGGILEVSTRSVAGEVSINIRDTGVGIAEDDRDLIFEPFYTTKPEVQGTGLGLSVSYGIISGHGGDISVSSEADMGSTFTVRLPLRRLKN